MVTETPSYFCSKKGESVTLLTVQFFIINCLAAHFDAVIGNPPYVRQETLGETFKGYAQAHYETYAGTADLYTYFIEKGVSLLKDKGLFSYIVANKWMRANYGKPLRTWLKKQCIEEIIDFGDLPVFENATTYPCVIMVSKATLKKEFKVANIADLDFVDLKQQVQQISFPIMKQYIQDTSWNLVEPNKQKLMDKLCNSGNTLGDYVNKEVYYGIKTGLNEAFVIDDKTRERLIKEDEKSAERIKPFLAGKEVKHYSKPLFKNYLLLFPKGWTDLQRGEVEPWTYLSKQFPAISKYLKPYEKKAEKRCDKGNYWWELRECKYYSDFETGKIIYPNICKRPEFTFDDNALYTNQKCFIIPRDDKYLLGILNSSVNHFLFEMILPKLRGGFFEPSYVFFKDFPIRTIDFSKPEEKAMHDQMVILVDRMLDLNKNLQEATVPQVKTTIQRQIESTDKQIDQLVYKLYDLTEEEIKIVEGG